VKKSKAETAKTRQRIVEVAAEEFRRNGIHETGVAEIMAAAGRTQGGFYRHFESKDQLVAEACSASMDQLVAAAKSAIESGNMAFLKHMDRFLSASHCEDWSGGCPIVFMGSELARADVNVREVVSEGFRELIDVMAGSGSGSRAARAEAILILSAMIGAVTIARILNDPKLSALVLKETKTHLANRFRRQQAEGG
jgi:TetR/AcrR family transcriptional regulator, transcriptional repressor for nem operon